MSLPFNDTTNKSGILQECESWLFGGDYGAITGNTNRKLTFTRLANLALDETVTEIQSYDQRWQFDDSNYTDYPIGVTNLVAGQQDYVFSVEHVRVLGVDVLGADGKYYPLKPIDIHDVRKYGKGKSLTEFEPTDGKPEYYDLTADAVKLYPAPAAASVTTASGLKVYYQRAADAFASTDTTKKPGIPSIFHQIIPVKMSRMFAKQNSMTEKARELDEEERRLREKMQQHYSNRHEEKAPRLAANVEATR